jgi:hypothetical protein
MPVWRWLAHSQYAGDDGRDRLIVYRKLGLMVLKKGWINFDLIWSAALLLVGCIALVMVAL